MPQRVALKNERINKLLLLRKLLLFSFFTHSKHNFIAVIKCLKKQKKQRISNGTEDKKKIRLFSSLVQNSN